MSSLRSLAAALILSAAPAFSQNRVVAYVPNWIDLEAFAASIDYPRLTHLNVAFENPVDETGELSFHPGDAVLIAQAHAHGVQVFVSIGGGSASGDKMLKARYAELLGESKRARFAQSLAAYVKAHDFDGLDVDIEGPSITSDYGPFIESLAAALQPHGKQLTAALSQGYGGSHVPDSVFAHFAWVNIMAYDATGPWNAKAPGQHSSMAFAKSSVDYWLGRGLPKAKAVLGVPFYGYGFGEAFKKRDYPFAEIVKTYPGAEAGDQVGNTIFYNGLTTIQAKARYVRESGLGGVMIWSLDEDAKGEGSLLKALGEVFGGQTKSL